MTNTTIKAKLGRPSKQDEALELLREELSTLSDETLRCRFNIEDNFGRGKGQTAREIKKEIYRRGIRINEELSGPSIQEEAMFE
jgi:hypothetical protein